MNNKIEKSKEQYHSWIRKNKHFLFPNKVNKHFLFPTKVNKSVSYDVKFSSKKFKLHSFYINQKIQGLGNRNYQVISQRNNIVSK